VLLWVASEFKDVLVRPTCPNVTQEFSTAEGNIQCGSSGGTARVTRRGVLSGVVVGLLVMFGMLLQYFTKGEQAWTIGECSGFGCHRYTQ
jgi:alpha,alpha-trehalase